MKRTRHEFSHGLDCEVVQSINAIRNHEENHITFSYSDDKPSKMDKYTDEIIKIPREDQEELDAMHLNLLEMKKEFEATNPQDQERKKLLKKKRFFSSRRAAPPCAPTEEQARDEGERAQRGGPPHPPAAPRRGFPSGRRPRKRHAPASQLQL